MFYYYYYNLIINLTFKNNFSASNKLRTSNRKIVSYFHNNKLYFNESISLLM